MNSKIAVAIGSDHGGFDLKQALIPYLKELGHSVVDCGIRDKATADYPRIAFGVAQRVAAGQCARGIIIDGAGIGSAMTANKVRGVRAAACYSVALANNAREHNDANVLTLGSGQTSLEDAKNIVAKFLSTDCTAARHLRRVRMIEEAERGALKVQAPDSESGKQENEVDLSPQDVERIAQRVRDLIAGGGSSASAGRGAPVTPTQLAGMIDHTILKPETSRSDVERVCKEALKYKFCSVCVNPVNVPQVAKMLKGSTVKVCCVVGFPLGAADPSIKALETRKAIREGAQEIDMVINVGAMKSGDYDLVLRDIRAVVEACAERHILSKVILETSLLTDEEKVKACELSMKAGAKYVKTSTGFSGGGATAADIALMSKTVASKKLGVKASGGVRNYQDAINMINAGATRIGASSSISIIEEAKAVAEGREYKPESKPKGAY